MFIRWKGKQICTWKKLNYSIFSVDLLRFTGEFITLYSPNCTFSYAEHITLLVFGSLVNQINIFPVKCLFGRAIRNYPAAVQEIMSNKALYAK